MNQKNQNEIEGAAYVSVVLGAVMLAVAVLIPVRPGTRFEEAGVGLAALAWGCRQIALAKKRKAGEPLTEQEQAEDKRLEKQIEKMEKGGSMRNVFLLLIWILTPIFFVVGCCIVYLFIFHRPN